MGGERCRSQSLHGTDAVVSREKRRESKAAPREGRQEGGRMSFTGKQSESQAPAVSARTTQGAKTHGRDGSWVEASVWNERMLAALGNGVKGGKWFSLIDKVYRAETLKAAWQKVKANAGAAGVDGQSVKRFAARAEMYLEELGTALKRGTYRPQPVRRVEIPKGGGKFRPLGIAVVKDRIVQTALKFVLEPIFEREFLKMSYGFRPGLGCKDALREVERLLKEGYTFVVDADLKSYFDTIPHVRLMERVGEKLSDGRVLELIEAYLQQDIIKEMERWTPIGGTPQGAVISPLLANIYLHPLDCQMQKKGFRMVRYADDCAPRRRGKEAARSNGSSFAAREMRGGPSGSGCRTRAQTTGCCSGPMIGVVSETEKAGPTRQVCAVKTNASEPSMTCRKRRDVHRNRAPVVGSGPTRGKPVDCSRGDRHEDGVSAAQLSCGTWEPSASMPRENSKRWTREEPSIDARRRGGWARRSDEAW